MSTELEKVTALSNLLSSKLGPELISCSLNINTAEISILPEKLLDLGRILKIDRDFTFEMLVSVTAVDWMDQKDNRFEVVYHLLSLSKGHRLRIKVPISESTPEVPSLVSIWGGADFMERECFDMYGIIFSGHPDLRRILMYDEFVGYPLRKDYPLQGKQPRIPLRHPEVRNTAVDMRRPELVSINKKQNSKTI